jgi:hypothetical protein
MISALPWTKARSTLKTDDREHVLQSRWGVNEKTIRKWVYVVLEALADLDVVSITCCSLFLTLLLALTAFWYCFTSLQVQWRFRKAVNSTANVYVTVDGTDFRIQEPRPFSKSWFSHKYNGPGVRYEVGICIKTGWIVWVNGPFKCGDCPDHVIVDLPGGLHDSLDHGERYIADKIYKSSLAINPYDSSCDYEKIYMGLCRGRHETLNRLFKTFQVIGNVFHRHVAMHGLFTHAIINIVQCGILCNEVNPFSIPLHEPSTGRFGGM